MNIKPVVFLINAFPHTEVHLYRGYSNMSPTGRYSRIEFVHPEVNTSQVVGGIRFIGNPTEPGKRHIDLLIDILTRLGDQPNENFNNDRSRIHEGDHIGYRFSYYDFMITIERDRHFTLLRSSFSKDELVTPEIRYSSMLKLKARIKTLSGVLNCLRELGDRWEQDGINLSDPDVHKEKRIPCPFITDIGAKRFDWRCIQSRPEAKSIKLISLLAFRLPNGNDKLTLAVGSMSLVVFDENQSKAVSRILRGIADGLRELGKDITTCQRIDILKEDPFNGYVSIIPGKRKNHVIINYDVIPDASKVTWALDDFDINEVIWGFTMMANAWEEF